MQGALQSLMDDGTYAAVLDRWDVGDGAVGSASVNLSGTSG